MDEDELDDDDIDYDSIEFVDPVLDIPAETVKEEKPAERVDIALLQELSAVCKKFGVTLSRYRLEGCLLDVRMFLDS